jgi:HSP20 family protein
MDTNTSAVAAREPRGAAAPQQGRVTETSILAPVDIFEDEEGITLEADMPGVSKDRLTVHVDNDTLVLEGKAQFDLPEQSEALYADVRSTAYRRSFALGRELETSNIQAQLKDGVLRVRIPKRAELRPRKIEVQ